MSASAWRGLRWLIMLGLCVAVVLVAVPAAIEAIRSSISINEQAQGSRDEGPDTDEASGPVRDGSAAAKTDFAVRGGTVQQVDDARLTVSGNAVDSGLVAGFDLIDGSPTCVASLEFAVDVVEASAGELGVYPAAINDVDAVDDGDTVDQLVLSEDAHAVTASEGTPGRISWDLTELYAQWTQDLTPPGTELAVVVRPEDGDQRLRVASVESDDSAGPRLGWSGEEGCA